MNAFLCYGPSIKLASRLAAKAAVSCFTRLGAIGVGLLLCGPILAASYYVSPNGNDSNAGTEAKPFQLIQTALTHCAAGDTVLLEAGTYSGTGNVDLVVGEAVTIGSVSGPASTIIDCKGSGSQYHRVLGFSGAGTSSSPCSLLNLTFKNGFEPNNGGILVIANQSNLKISGCSFISNQVQGTSGEGGAIYEDATSTVSVTNCTFSLNGSEDFGAAYYNLGTLTVQNCSFANGSARVGGALYNNGNAVFVNCSFLQNQQQGAGTIANDQQGSLELDGCTINGNTCFATSGTIGTSGIFNAGKMSAYGCLFGNNSASQFAGAIYNSNSSISCLLENCIFTGNSAPQGGAIYSNGPINVFGCTFSGNMATGPNGGGAIFGDVDSNGSITDTILWGDSASSQPTTAELAISTSMFVTYSDVEMGQAGNGNTKLNPLFLSSTDYHLQSASPCLYTGTQVVGLTTDYAGRARHNPTSMGAYEGGSLWSVVATLVSPNQNKRILWKSVEGEAWLWTVTPNNVITKYTYGPAAGFTPIGLAIGPDNNAYLVWQLASGEVAVWNIAANGTHTTTILNPGTAWNFVSLSISSDSYLHISWQNKAGQLAIWNISTKGARANQEYGPF